MKYLQLFENWLLQSRDILPIPDSNVQWKDVKGNVTSDTLKLLTSLQDKWHDVALFSWHPNIRMAQYSPSGDTFDSNYNSRLWISGSLICLAAEKNQSKEGFDDRRNIELALKSFPVNAMGGSGNTENGRAVRQIQLSFLTKDVGTHEEAKKIKESTFTPGAYTFESGKWKYIPAEDFDVMPKLNAEFKKLMILLEDSFTVCDNVSSVKSHLRETSFTIRVNTTSPKWTKGWFEVTVKPSKPPEYKIEIVGQNNVHSNNTIKHVDTIEDMLLVSDLFPEDVNHKLAVKYREDKNVYEKVLNDFLHQKRGQLKSKKFNF
jgi:hypothetical protein